MKALLVSIVAIFLGSIPIVCDADYEGWWLFDDGQACFRIASDETCLPRSFEITRIEENRVEFVGRKNVANTFQLTHERGQRIDAVVNSYVSADFFDSIAEVRVGGLPIHRFDMPTALEGHPLLAVRVLEFGDADCLVIRGELTPEIDEIAKAIASQWKPGAD